MGNTTERAKGKLEELAGKAKARMGKLIDNEQMQFEGAARQLTGRAKQELAKVGERAKGKVEQVKGRAKQRVGELIKNHQMQAEGALSALKGAARERLHK